MVECNLVFWCGDLGIAPGVSPLVYEVFFFLNDTRTFRINLLSIKQIYKIMSKKEL